MEIRHLSKAYPVETGLLQKRVDQVQALSDVSFEVQRSETLAIVGGSGCGKSTLARIIAGLLPQDVGEILWEGKPLQTYSRQERARRIQMIFQDPYASLNPKLSIGTQLAEVSRAVPGSVLLESVGLPAEALSHYPFQFSGGQRQRIAIARALALDPPLLIADEPLSALDSTTQTQVLELLRRLKSSRGLALLFITHDLAVIEDFADRVIVLQEGKVVEEGPVRRVLQSPRHSYTQALLNAVPRVQC